MVIAMRLLSSPATALLFFRRQPRTNVDLRVHAVSVRESDSSRNPVAASEPGEVYAQGLAPGNDRKHKFKNRKKTPHPVYTH